MPKEKVEPWMEFYIFSQIFIGTKLTADIIPSTLISPNFGPNSAVSKDDLDLTQLYSTPKVQQCDYYKSVVIKA